ncbi:MAG: hypothetical protein WC667_12920 [Sulfurimonas sp.]|jgi:hypothetical protein
MIGVAMGFKKNFEQTIILFEELVKEELEELLKVEVISIEGDVGRDSLVTSTLDLHASSDLIIKYKDDTSIYTASNRILKIADKYLHLPISLTLRNSISGEYDKTEVNKLKTSHDKILHNIPVVMPKIICNSRLINVEGDYKLLDIIIVDTMPLIECIFSHKGFVKRTLKLGS